MRVSGADGEALAGVGQIDSLPGECRRVPDEVLLDRLPLLVITLIGRTLEEIADPRLAGR